MRSGISDNVKFGITGPETLESSTNKGIKASNDLKVYLENCNFYESEDQAITRERTMGKIDHLLKTFVKKISKSRGEYKDCGGKIFTFGSYRLGVHDKGADIDTLCVIPRHVSRKDFFSTFYEMLLEDDNAKEVSKVEEAYVPVIKMKYQNIPIDLTVARVPLSVVDNEINLLDETLLKSMDEKCILSLNGSRLSDTMLNLVPDVKVFHETLRAIKLWAKKRDVYGNTFGYFGGVAFSISVARICQMFPNMASFDVFKKYFEIYTKWKWPNAVILKPIVDYHYNLKNWNPDKHPADRAHKMPIITPIYPSMCATHNVTKSTFNTIVKEIQRANEILSAGDDFKLVFEYTNFFSRYSAFVKVFISAMDDKSYKLWHGFIESKIRVLATKLETIGDIEGAIPLPKAFKIDNTSTFFIGIDVLKFKNTTRRVFGDIPVREFIEFVCEWSEKSSDMKIEINTAKRHDIKEFLRNYLKK